MMYAKRIWRGLQLGLDLFFLRLAALGILDDDSRWYILLFCWLLIGVFMALAMDDFMRLRELFRKPRKPRGADAY